MHVYKDNVMHMCLHPYILVVCFVCACVRFSHTFIYILSLLDKLLIVLDTGFSRFPCVYKQMLTDGSQHSQLPLHASHVALQT